MSISISLPDTYRYIRISIDPPISEPLALRKTLETAMSQSFGVSRSGTYVDVLWISPDGRDAVFRVGVLDAEAVLAAIVVLDSPVRLSVTKDSTFLPALLGNTEIWTQSSAL